MIQYVNIFVQLNTGTTGYQVEHQSCTHAKLLESCLTCTLWTQPARSLCSQGFSRQKYWSGLVAMPSSRGSSQPKDPTQVSFVSCIGRRVLYHQCHLGSPGTSVIGGSIFYMVRKWIHSPVSQLYIISLSLENFF